jgi:hypothetical protein
MNEISLGAATLAERAREAAAYRYGDGAESETQVALRDAHWAERARQVTRHVADLLGVEYRDLQVRADRSPARGRRIRWVEVSVSDGADQYAFTVPYETPERILALAPCPECRLPVPTRLITSLADLGQLLTELAEQPPQPGNNLYRHGSEVVPEFTCTEHEITCPNHLYSVLFPPRPAPRTTPAPDSQTGH